MRFEAPHEREAEKRAWLVVRDAYRLREPLPAPRRRLRPAVALAVAAAVVACVVSPPGRAVLGSLRRAVGVEPAAPALFRLPTAGKLLVRSDEGAWIVHADGSKRLLPGWRDAAWSPFGRYVAVAGPDELAAVDLDGHVRWSLARPAVRLPDWGGTRTDTRIAYLTRSRLHVVAGDGRSDGDPGGRPAAARVAPAWQPRRFLLAYVTTRGRVKAYNAVAGTVAWQSDTHFPRPSRLEWSSDGRLLLVVTHGKASVVRDGRVVAVRSGRVTAAAFRPGSHTLAAVRRHGGTSEVLVGPRVVFRGTGVFEDISWSPDGKWLLVTWPTADQWVFVRVAGGRRIRAVANVTRQFEGGAFPKIAGWCCSAG